MHRIRTTRSSSTSYDTSYRVSIGMGGSDLSYVWASAAVHMPSQKLERIGTKQLHQVGFYNISRNRFSDVFFSIFINFFAFNGFHTKMRVSRQPGTRELPDNVATLQRMVAFILCFTKRNRVQNWWQTQTYDTPVQTVHPILMLTLT